MSAQNKKTKIILLNPPAEGIFVRDYYCSFSSKACYYWPPQDLIVLSGILSEEFEIRVIDAIGQKMSARDCYKQILDSDFNAIVFSTGTATLENDIKFISDLKKERTFKAIASSAIFAFGGIELMDRFKVIDAAVTNLFNSGIGNYLNGNFKDVKGMIYRDNVRIVIANFDRNGVDIQFSIPLHDFFVHHKYSFPFCRSPFAVTIASIGCPFKCKFCIAGQIKFKLRGLNNLLEEINYIKSLGINDIFFADPTFTANKDYSIEFCKEITNLKVRWVCNSDIYPLLDEGFVILLRKSGCHTIMIGVESGDGDILERYSDKTGFKEIKDAFKICKINNICTLAYFILGLPGETKSSVLKTINFSKELGCDFVSFDFATPDLGTELRRELIEKNIISSDLVYGWDPSKKPVYPIESLSQEDMVKLRNRAYREFYLRPSYIKNRILNLNSGKQLKDMLKGGLSLFLKR